MKMKCTMNVKWTYTDKSNSYSFLEYLYTHVSFCLGLQLNPSGVTLYRYQGLEAVLLVLLSMPSLKHLANCQICQYEVHMGL